jgi:hypothetical protein
MRKVDGLGRIFIDFFAPALTPRLNITEPSLQLSANITLFAIAINNNNDDDNSTLYYLSAESTTTRPITDIA